jgi:hypothetical protein
MNTEDFSAGIAEICAHSPLAPGRPLRWIIIAEYVHRGVAYRIRTDEQGNISFPRGSYVMRTIGYIKDPSPQVLSPDFAANGTASSVDWRKVWDSSVPAGNSIAGSDTRTGPIQND